MKDAAPKRQARSTGRTASRLSLRDGRDRLTMLAKLEQKVDPTTGDIPYTPEIAECLPS
jgi:hypothetical protein